MEKVVASTPWGDLFVYADDHIGKSIIRNGQYEGGMINTILNNIPEKDCVAIDIGANVGAHTIAYAKNFTQVWAYEPQDPVRELLLESMAYNNLTNVTISGCAVGHTSGVTYMEDGSNPKNMGGVGMGVSGIEKNIIRLDDEKWDKLGLIKIDIEGAENLALFGSRETIAEHRPVIFWENNPPQVFMDRYSLYDRNIRNFNPLEYLMCDLNYYRVEKLGHNLIAMP